MARYQVLITIAITMLTMRQMDFFIVYLDKIHVTKPIRWSSRTTIWVYTKFTPAAASVSTPPPFPVSVAAPKVSISFRYIYFAWVTAVSAYVAIAILRTPLKATMVELYAIILFNRRSLVVVRTNVTMTWTISYRCLRWWMRRKPSCRPTQLSTCRDFRQFRVRCRRWLLPLSTLPLPRWSLLSKIFRSRWIQFLLSWTKWRQPRRL